MLLLAISGCHRKPGQIAVIPRTSGTMMWEPEHLGVLMAARNFGVSIYWNAPTREDDVLGQIALIDTVSRGNYQGLVLSPDHSLQLVTPVLRAMMHGVPTVVTGSPLDIPASGNLAYVLNNEQKGAALATERLATILHRRGLIAITGVDADIAGIVTRSRALQLDLQRLWPKMHVVAVTRGSFNAPREEQSAEELLKAHPDVNAIVTLTAPATRGALAALSARGLPGVRILSFDPDQMTFDSPFLDATIIENTRLMGARAVEEIMNYRAGRAFPPVTEVDPVLVTRENMHTPEVDALTSMNWQPPEERWKWTVGP